MKELEKSMMCGKCNLLLEVGKIDLSKTKKKYSLDGINGFNLTK
ncbi:hypothetical protein Psch_04168 [Pelotomaculum schinkii]|uniref:Uncharacterized protein n=1 Tax=Pelotomaculum schinkii TaxID=78350 RepID=A0A4Y7R724_9FIRM|nr:hypothetical protein [Pelotomaculum schinkii]TEB04441.1 hypothetical protein Psch_04168 [Pelotomaculum schinkii]